MADSVGLDSFDNKSNSESPAAIPTPQAIGWLGSMSDSADAPTSRKTDASPAKAVCSWVASKMEAHSSGEANSLSWRAFQQDWAQ